MKKFTKNIVKINFYDEIGDVVFLDDDGLIEQAYDKEDE